MADKKASENKEKAKWQPARVGHRFDKGKLAGHAKRGVGGQDGGKAESYGMNGQTDQTEGGIFGEEGKIKWSADDVGKPAQVKVGVGVHAHRARACDAEEQRQGEDQIGGVGGLTAFGAFDQGKTATEQNDQEKDEISHEVPGQRLTNRTTAVEPCAEPTRVYRLRHRRRIRRANLWQWSREKAR